METRTLPSAQRGGFYLSFKAAKEAPVTRRLLLGTLWLTIAVVASLYVWASRQGRPLEGVSALQEVAETPTLAGKAVPEVSLSMLKPYREAWGETLVLEDFVGKTPLVVSFWASWCPPCRREAPLLEAAWQRYRGRVQFVGVNFQDQEAEALKFIEEFSQSFPSGADPRGEAGVAFEVVGMPTTYFVNLDGTIQAQKVGELRADELETYLKDLLSPKRP